MVGFGSEERAYEMETQGEDLKLCPICNKRIEEDSRADKIFCSRKCYHKAWRFKNKDRFNELCRSSSRKWQLKNIKKGLCACGRKPKSPFKNCETCLNKFRKYQESVKK